jgi:hypothetical protein
MRLFQYLEIEAKAREDSLEIFKPELQVLDDLLGFYVGFLDLLTIEGGVAAAVGHLYLVTTEQLCGAASQLLNRTLSGSRARVRRAIEAAGIAHLLAEEPDLLPIFIGAYPNTKNVGATNQFMPFREYLDTFRTSKTLGQNVEPWPFLRTMYAIHSMLATHSGMGAFSGHKWANGKIKALLMETDQKRIISEWYSAAATFKVIWEVFLSLLRKWGPEEAEVAKVVIDFHAWWRSASSQVRERAPWAVDLPLAAVSGGSPST